MGGLVNKAGGLDQILGRQAPTIGAGAAYRAIFGHGDGFAQFGCMQGRGKGGRAAAENHQVVGRVCERHRVVSLPLRLAFRGAALDQINGIGINLHREYMPVAHASRPTI